ncbi:Golgi transport complex subunit 3 [Microbotryomycetes sp. JL221]|nr:Golgi transport complex subunit 3 [Microbotryomycetes sp. JL221]
MSSRATTSRVSLEDWDSLAPLSAQESASVSRVSAAATKRKLPVHLTQTQAVNGSSNNGLRSGTPILRKPSHINLHRVGSPLSRPQSASGNRELAGTGKNTVATLDDSLDVLEPIETTQQFHDWFTKVERSIERGQERVYRQHVDELDQYIGSCDIVLEQLDDARALLSEMEANFRFVEDNSRALQLACENMLDEQKHLIEVTEAIGARLEYFRELETATRMLNLPGEELVLQEDFLNLLDRLDACLDYLKSNRDFKDAELYIIRFQQCLTRSMTLIKMYFVSTIRKLTTEVQDKMAGKELSETALNALLYAKFSSAAETLKILVSELEKRAIIDPREYSALLNECYGSWFNSRSALLSSSLIEEVRRMDPANSDLIKLARAGCNHLRSVCMSEWSLYRQMFSSGESEAYRFLESLCDYLYDSLRPRILHEQRLEALCELCTVLSAMMGLDSNAIDDDDDDPDQEVGPSDDFAIGGVSTKVSVGPLRFSVLLETIQQDAQTRLVFRAQAVIQAEVLHYSPTSEDIKYPEKLEAHKHEALTLWTEDERMRETEVGGFRMPREEVQVTWYPTLRRTIWVLSRLNTYVNSAVFEDFAGEAVTLCRKSLSTAAAQVGMRSPESRTDGQLFLIRHLLLLKEMVRSVDLTHIERAADFSTVTDALVNLLRNTSAIFKPSALFELAVKGMPNFTETMTDAKTDLDGALKRACEELISDTSTQTALSIKQFLEKCTAFLSAPNGQELSAQAWATSEQVLALYDEFQKGVDAKVTSVVDKMWLYLSDEKTVGVLLPPLLDEIVETYSTFFNLIRSEYPFDTSSSLAQPSSVKEALERASRASPAS